MAMKLASAISHTLENRWNLHWACYFRFIRSGVANRIHELVVARSSSAVRTEEKGRDARFAAADVAMQLIWSLSLRRSNRMRLHRAAVKFLTLFGLQDGCGFVSVVKSHISPFLWFFLSFCIYFVSLFFEKLFVSLDDGMWRCMSMNIIWYVV